jgi:hypothetical protein
LKNKNGEKNKFVELKIFLRVYPYFPVVNCAERLIVSAFFIVLGNKCRNSKYPNTILQNSIHNSRKNVFSVIERFTFYFPYRYHAVPLTDLVRIGLGNHIYETHLIG